MTFENIERAHTVAEMLLAAWNGYCKKHQSHPDLCGATEEFREKSGKVLKGVGSLLAVYGIAKCLDAVLENKKY